jgi:exonuclease SbcC
MKIKSLRLAGFGPYRHEQFVDFEEFDDDGIFLITGKTGAGKSSILDAVCYALYGSVPRYEGAQQRLRSDHASPEDPTFVELVFSIEGTDYRVHRTPEFERAKKNGKGTTKAPPTAELFERSSDGWEGIFAGPVDVGKGLLELIGLTKDQFLQVILLAQNRFQEFLRSNNEDRQSVLRSLFGSQRFAAYEAIIVERRKALEGQVSGARDAVVQLAAQLEHLLQNGQTQIGQLQTGQLQTDLAWFEDGLMSIQAQHSAALSEAAERDAALLATDEEHRRLTAIHALQRRRDTAQTTLATLIERAQEVDEVRDAVAAALRAASVWPHVIARREADDALRSARSSELQARADFAPFALAPFAPDSLAPDPLAPDPLAPDQCTVARSGADSVSLNAVIDRLTRLLGSLDRALSQEASLVRLRAEADASEADLALIESAVRDATATIEAIPQRIDDESGQLQAALIDAAGQSAASETMVRIADALEAAERARTLDAQLAIARSVELASGRMHLAAVTHHQSLMEQRLAGHAFELASALVIGEPCAVCGSADHPAPATTDAEPVTQDDIDLARQQADELRVVLDQATADSTDLANRLAEASARTGGKSPDELGAQLASARDVLSRAVAAGERATAIEARVTELKAELDAARAGLAELRTSRDTAAGRVIEGRVARDAAQKMVDAERGEHESVAARVEQLQLGLTSAKNLKAAIDDTLARERSFTRALGVLLGQLLEHGFVDAEEAERLGGVVGDRREEAAAPERVDASLEVVRPGEPEKAAAPERMEASPGVTRLEELEDAVASARLAPAELERLDALIRSYDQGLATARSTLTEPELANLPTEPVELDDAAELLTVLRGFRDDAFGTLSTLTERVKEATRTVVAARAQLSAFASLQTEFEQLSELANAVQGKEPNTRRMRLETYVLAAQLEQIVAAANARLRVMTSGRFTLEHDDSVQYRNAQSGLGLAILDEHTGRSRATHSLSGGETFLASLALALGLAEVVTNQAGGIRLDTLFIDEGFGSLDDETLEIAMGTLDGLRAGGRTIGLISHVGSMKEQILSKLHVTVDEQGTSRIESSSPAAAR